MLLDDVYIVHTANHCSPPDPCQYFPTHNLNLLMAMVAACFHPCCLKIAKVPGAYQILMHQHWRPQQQPLPDPSSRLAPLTLYTQMMTIVVMATIKWLALYTLRPRRIWLVRATGSRIKHILSTTRSNSKLRKRFPGKSL